MTLTRPSSVHSVHCLEPRSYCFPRKTFRYCNHYFIQQPVDAITKGSGAGGIICCKEPALEFINAFLIRLSAHDGYGSCFFFVCLFSFCFFVSLLF